jgi:hypothetical protein
MANQQPRRPQAEPADEMAVGYSLRRAYKKMQPNYDVCHGFVIASGGESIRVAREKKSARHDMR